jgi:hypothetical protein
MNSCEFREFVVIKDSEIENGILGLERDVYLSIVKFLNSSILRNVWVNFFCVFFFLIWIFCSILVLVKNHTHEWNTFTSWFIDWKVLLLVIVVIFIYLFTNLFYFTVCIFSEIEFIKLLDDVKIKGKTITFTKDCKYRTVFINKMINIGIMKMFIYYYSYIYIFYFVSEVLCICTDDRGCFSMRNFFFFL